MNNTPPTAKNEKKSGFPFFWLLPLAAIALSGWLIIDTVSRSGIEIYITFEDASGLEPGKTDIRYNGVKVGKVKDLEIKEDLSGVTVKAELSRSAASIAREGAEFWIVRPNFSLAGISGIETLISGNFISVTAGEGEETKTFQGLEEEPPSDPNSPELYVILESTLAPAVVEGSPVLFRGAPIGEVVQTGFDHDRFMSTVEIRIADHCRGYVRKNSVFWDSSGLNIQFDLNSSTIKTGSLVSGLLGSITVSSPKNKANWLPASEHGDRFELYPSIEEAIVQNKEQALKSLKEEEKSLGHAFTLAIPKAGGIGPGSSIQYNGIRVGEIISMLWDDELRQIQALCTLDDRYASLLTRDSRFFLIYPEVKIEGLSTVKMSSDVLKGPYIDLVAGSGPHHTEFILEVLDDPTYRPIEGLKITLHMKRLGKVSQGSPIYYRGIQVGQIEATRLSDTAQRAELDAVIFKKYASLVRQGSQFWNVSGIETSLSLLGGLRLNTTSFKSVLEGALAFATPEQSSPRANHGSLFNVAEKPEKRWLQWEPNIDFDSSGAKSLQ